MTFSPVVPSGGLSGWSFVDRTITQQKLALSTSAVVKREMDYFRENISKVSTPEQLVGDYQLMKVTLGAFGLQDDQQNKFFIRKVLAEGTLDSSSLANRLSDPRYKAMTDAFNFNGLGNPNTKLPGFADRILNAYTDQTFEVAVGNTSPDLRLALGLERELQNVVSSTSSENARWFGVMGNPPLRKVFEGAFNLPTSFATLDIDRQLTVFRERSEAMFGISEVAEFADPENMTALRNRFLIMSEITNGAATAVNAPILGLFSTGAQSIGAASLLNTLYS